MIWVRPTQAHCVEVFLMQFGPSRLFPGLRQGSKGAPKMKIFTFWLFFPPNGPGSGRHQNIIVTYDTGKTFGGKIGTSNFFVLAPDTK